MTSLLLALLLLVAGLVALLLRLRARNRDFDRIRADLERSFETRRELERAQAAAAERERIYNDLHDDIGAKLLNLIYGAREPQQADLARSVLQDLRDVVSRSRGTPGSLLEVLSDIHAESGQRLGSLGVDLLWEQAETLPDPVLDHSQALHLYRIVREALTNALRHARPRRMRIRVRQAPAELLLEITDEGGDEAPTVAVGAGRGTQGMQERAAELHGSIAWSSGTLGGTKVLLRVPLAA